MAYQCLRLLFVSLVSVTLTRALYYIDNNDSRIQYSPQWNYSEPANDSHNEPSLDQSKLYGGSYSVLSGGGCLTVYNCTMRISFEGTRITLYAVMREAVKLNVSVDGDTQTSYHFDGVWNCCNRTFPEAYNFPIGDITSLSPGSHDLLLTVLDCETGYNCNGPNAQFSQLVFDYAVVKNETSPYPTSTPSTNPSTTAASQSSSSHSVIGPAVGGVVGGITVIFIILITTVCMRRRSRKKDRIDIDSALPIVHATPVFGAGLQQGINDIPKNLAMGLPQMLAVNQTTQVPSSKPTTFPETHASLSPSPFPPLSNPQVDRPSSSVLDVIPPIEGQITSSDSDLAAEEAQFLQGLYRRNVPPQEIRNLMQLMRARQEASGEANLNSEVTKTLESVPPAYVFTG